MNPPTAPFTRRRAILTASIIASCAAVLPASAASLLLNSGAGWNGFFLEARIEAGFSADNIFFQEVSVVDSGFLVIAPDVVVPNQTLTLVSTTTGEPLSVTYVPTFGADKDIATGTLSLTFTVGTDTTPDSFDIQFTSTTSAEEAFEIFPLFPAEADAFFRLAIRLSSSHPATMPGAAIQIPDLPELSDPMTESLGASFQFYQSGMPVFGFTAPGDSGTTLPLDLASFGEEFIYQLNYRITTPFGTDPTYNYSFSGIALVPEPSGSVLIAMAALVLAARRRR